MLVQGFFEEIAKYVFRNLNGYQDDVVIFTLTLGIVINIISCFVFKWHIFRQICKIADSIIYSLSSFYLTVLCLASIILSKFVNFISPIISSKQIISLFIVFLISQVVRNFIVRKSR